MGRHAAYLVALSLGLFAGTVATPSYAIGVAVEAATPEQKTEAQNKFKEGYQAFQSKEFDKAAAAFRASFDVVASPNTHLMIARSLREGGHLSDAYQELDEASKEAEAAAAKDPKYSEAAGAAKTELAELRARVVLLKLSIQGAPNNATVTLNDAPLDPAKWNATVAAAPGDLKLSVSAPGKKPVERSAAAAAGGEASISLDLGKEWAAPAPVAPPPPPPEPAKVSTSNFDMRTWSYVAGGVGVAGLATFTIFGLMNKSKYDDLQSSCTNSICSSERSSDIDAGKQYQTIANVGLVVGVVGLGAGATLFFLDKKSKPSTTGSAPTLYVGPASVQLQGKF